MFTKFFGVTNRNKFLNELEKVLKEKFADKEDIDKIISSIGQADGIASLDGSGKVPSEQLPSYVDDIIEVEDYAHLPEEGEIGKIYITLDTGNQYRWGGSEYVPLNENSIQGIGIKKIIKLTQAEYDALQEKDSEAIYITSAPQAFANGVYILYTDGSLSNYDTLDAGKTPVGPVLKTDNICVVIHPDEGSTKKWQTSPFSVINGVTTVGTEAEALLDYSGLSNTTAAINSGAVGNLFSWVTGIVYADGRSGYIPSAGENRDLNRNRNNINIALALTSGTPLSTGEYWTSTQQRSDSAFAYRFGVTDYPNTVAKDNDYYCRSISTYNPPLSYKLYQGSNLIASSEDINRINNLEDKVTELESTKADKLISPTAGHLVKTDALGGLLDAGLAIVKMTKAEYDALVTKDPLTMYLVDEALEPTFGGLVIAPSPLYYGANGYEIKDNDWFSNSYSTNKYGSVEGSYCHSYLDLGKYMDSRGANFDANSGIIDNNGNKISYDGKNDWRLPTEDEARIILDTLSPEPSYHRTGSLVNGTRLYRKKISVVSTLTDYESALWGYLIFPDDKVITGKSLSDSGFTESDINNYVSQGCIFIHYSAYYNSSWNSWNYSSSSTNRFVNALSSTSSNDRIKTMNFASTNSTVSDTYKRFYHNVLLCSDTVRKIERIYLGSVLIADSNTINDIASILATI